MGRGGGGGCPLPPVKEEDHSSRVVLVGVSVLGARGFGHLLLRAHIHSGGGGGGGPCMRPSPPAPSPSSFER